MTFLRHLTSAALVVMPTLVATPAHAFFVDGEGHYGLRGETRTAEAFSKKTGTYQAIEQTFRLQGEARFNDQSSMFLEFRLFDDPRRAYMGDVTQPAGDVDCEQYAGDNVDVNDSKSPCKHQDSGEPRYEPYTPKVTKAFVRYAFDYCIIEAGRRPRQWGLGIFMDAGNKPFDTDMSVYDGFTCNVNIQKTQALGFSVGYDKLAETGTYVFSDGQVPLNRSLGANDSGDDLDQYFFTIEYDDRKSNAGAAFTKQVGVYFAQINGRDLNNGGSNTDLKFLDLYTGFYFADFALRNELLFRMGKSADPNWQALGGATLDNGNPATNKLNAIAIAGSLDWTLSRSGAAIGPADYNRGDASRHSLFFNYAFAPGDDDGYRTSADNADSPGSQVVGDTYGRSTRDKDVTAMAFHRNFKPALLLFNGRPETDQINVDGSFNSSRVMNATVFGTGYRFESMENGNFEAKLVTASLNKGTPSEIKNYYNAYVATLPANADGSPGDDGSRPAGFYGTSLGYELDLSYSYKVGREAELGVAAAAALPGDAWQTSKANKPTGNFLIQTSAAFNF